MKKILIVDDSLLARQALREIAESAGYQVEEAGDGDEAIAKYPVSRPDLVMLDLLMERTGGMEALGKLLALDPQAKVMIASAVVHLAAQAEARRAGAVGYIAKPFDREEILEKMARVLSGEGGIELSEWHHSSLSELIHVGFGRAAGALSQMTGRRVLLEAPRMRVIPVYELGAMLGGAWPGEVASVHQEFSGELSGVALLLTGKEAAPLFRGLLQGVESQDQTWDDTAGEGLKEVGNVLLNSCLGVLSNLAQVPLTLAIPRLRVKPIEDTLRSLWDGDRELARAVVIQTCLRLQDTNVICCLAILLGMASYNRLLRGLEALNNWAPCHSSP